MKTQSRVQMVIALWAVLSTSISSLIAEFPAGGLQAGGQWRSVNLDDLIVQPGMQFNIDVWLNDGEYGLRYEDGIVVTEDGIEELTSYRREIIEL